MTKISEVLVEKFYEPIPSIQESSTVKELVMQMKEQKTTFLAVTDSNGKLKGCVFDYSLLKIVKQESISPIAGSVWADNIESFHASKTVREIMDTKIVTIMLADTIDSALRTMNSNDARILTVVDRDGRYLGVLRIRTIFERLLREIE